MKNHTCLASLVLINISFTNAFLSAYPIIPTKYGPVKGKVESLIHGKKYYSFRGIPYAKPPVRELRFKNPEEPLKWTQTLDATNEGPFCIQRNYLFENNLVEGQEDCLYLNVYVPQITDPKNLPVMVFIHWGGFFAGRGTSDYLDPSYILDQGVILVTFNYRLGIFGFLSTLDDSAPGNVALKDQRLALRWVQENIKNFGGNKLDVTIFGQSAGAASVHYHMLSPFSKGLFHKAISQSGSALAIWAKPGNDLQTTVVAAQAAAVGCDSYIGDSKSLVICLQNVSADYLLQTQEIFKVFDVDPLTAYTTVIEKITENNPQPIFTKSLLEHIESGEFAKMPWLIGGVEDEGILKTSVILRKKKLREELNADFDVNIPVLMGWSLSTNDTNQLQKNVVDFYLNGEHFVNISKPERIKNFTNLYTDRVFAYASYQSALLHAAKGHNPIFFYNFNYRGEYSYGNLFASTNKSIDYNWGASHCDELLYLFRSPSLFPDLKHGKDIKMKKIMVKLWTNFAKFGDPNFVENKVFDFLDWTPLNVEGLNDMRNDKLCYLDINGNYKRNQLFIKVCGFKKERMQFWGKQNLIENFPGLY